MISNFGYALFAYVLVITLFGARCVAYEDFVEHVEASVRNASDVSYGSCHDQLHESILESSIILEGSKEARRPSSQFTNSTEIHAQNSTSRDDARVAHCIVGSARTLWHPHAYKSIQDNFISALGGLHNTFMYLKLLKTAEAFTLK